MNHPATGTGAAGDLEALLGSGRFSEAFQRFGADSAIRHESPQVELSVATAAARLGEYRRATQLAASALRRFAEEPNPAGQMRAFNLLGGIAFEQGLLDEADSCFRDAERLADSLRDELARAKAINNRAMIAHLRGRAHLAVKLWLESLLRYDALQDLRGAVQTHHNLALAYRELGLLHAAQQHNGRAAALVDQVSDPALEGVVALGVAELAWTQGQSQAARELLDRATVRAQSSGDQSGQVAASRLRALMQIASGEYQVACVEAAAARDVAERLGAAVLAAECGVIHALALVGGGDRVGAEQLFQRSVQALERLGAARLTVWADREWARISPGV